MKRISLAPFHKSILFYSLPFLLAFVLMLPRLLSSQFGFEDDGISLSMAQKLLANITVVLDSAYGVFRPFYWLGILIQYWIGGTNPFWFYFINLVVLWVVTFEIIALVRVKGGTIVQSCLSAGLFVLSSPVIESFYTNSKPEAQQLMWLASSLLSGHFLTHPQNSKRLVAFVATIAFILFAGLNKSTFITLVPVALGWLVLCLIFIRKDREEVYRSGYYLVSVLAATAFFLILRRWTLPSGLLQGSYANNYTLNINFMIFMMNYWVAWLLRGYLGLLPSLVFLLAFWKKITPATRRLAIASLVWMTGWLVIYLPWDRALDYYLLPFAWGYAIFCGMTLGSLPVIWPVEKLPARIAMTGIVGFFSLLGLMGMLTYISNAKVQLIMDKQNMNLLSYLAKNAPRNARIAYNFNENATFFTHVPLLASIVANRSDIHFIPFEFQNTQVQNNEPYLLIMPEVHNQPLVKVRGISDGQELANKSMETFIGNALPIFATEGKAPLLTFNPALLLCPFMNSLPFYSIYCNKPESLLVDNRDFSYGWLVYRIDTSKQNLPLPAVITPDGGFVPRFSDGSNSKYSFPSGHQALSVDWNGDGITDIVLFDPADLTWRVFSSPIDQMDHEFILLGMKLGDIPLAGDWDCDGKATPGYFRPADLSWHLWNDLKGDEIDVALSGIHPTDYPIVGDWNGDGCDTVGVYRPDKGEVNLENRLMADLSGIDFYAPASSIPVPADWGGIGMVTLGFFNDGQWQIMYANCECVPANGFESFDFGGMDDIPLAGRWQ